MHILILLVIIIDFIFLSVWFLFLMLSPIFLSIKERLRFVKPINTHKSKTIFHQRMGTLQCNVFLSHLSLFMLLNGIHHFTLAVQTICHVDEGSALLQFKESFTVTHKSVHPKMASWTAEGGKMNLSCCSWSGVRCDEYSGYVIGLDLRSSDLHGSINSSSSLFRLAHLQMLDLSDNDFNLSEIPSGLGIDLASLTYLNLSHCSFHGEFPVSIFHLPNLQVLDLNTNQDLTGHFPDFNRSSRLEYLNVGRTNFSAYLPASIGNLHSLKFFNIEYCEFYPHVPSSLGNLTQLNHLDLSFFFDSSFTHSDISPENFNLLDTDSWSWIGKLTKLQHLGLGHTYLKGEFPTFVTNLTQLEELDLGNNQITGDIPFWLMKFTQLTLLNLRFNNLQGAFPTSLFNLHNLEYLDLSSNNLIGSVDFDNFFNLKRLRVLRLSFNKLSLHMRSGLKVTAPKFQVLKLASCNLTEFPEFLKNSSGLVDIDLSDNHIHGQVPQWFLSTTRESLLYLSLSRNSLTGLDQKLLLPWTKLLVFEFGFNMLHGSLPVPPPTIQIYSVPNNRLSGEISGCFCNLSYMFILDLSDNSLGGLIPECLGNKAAIQILNLQNNCFSGEIPPMCTDQSSLKSIDLSKNRLQGKLPRSMENCTRLEILNLAENIFNDTYPSWLGALPLLKALILRSNMFHGTIAKSTTDQDFTNLCRIDVSFNSLSGMFPSNYMENWSCLKSVAVDEDSYLQDTYRAGGITYHYDYSISNSGIGVELKPLKYGNSPYVKAIDLSCNNFEGDIPWTFGDLRGLQSLNLSMNSITGNIPSSIGYLTELKVLDLSRNRLSGELPGSLVQLTSLSLINVSDNYLRGPIPSGNQFSTFVSSSFQGNPGLCGDPLRVECEDSETTKSPPSPAEKDHPGFPFEWGLFFPAGLVSGLVVGFVAGNTLTSNKQQWFVEKFGKRRRQPRRTRGGRAYMH